MTASMPSSPPPAAIDTLAGGTMGTTWQVRAALPAGRDLRAWHDGVQARLDAVVAEMSHWIADSDLSRFNAAPAGSLHRLPDDAFTVLDCARAIAEASGGAFDPTVSPLVSLWGFGPGGGAGRVPRDAEIAARLRAVGWRRLVLDADARSVVQPGGLVVDLSAIAKGFGADAVAAWLRARDVAGALVEVGGELRAFGRRPDGMPWRVLVETAEDAIDADAAPCVVALDDAGCATSGDRWHRFEVDGRRYAHTLDPRTGRPVAHATAAVTVVAASAMQADAWSTALGVMGFDAGLAFARARGFAARFVTTADGGLRIATTPAFDAVQVDA